MSGAGRSGRETPFGRGELPAGGGADDLAADVRLGRKLEGVGGPAPVLPSADFTDRVMAAIEAEPVPAPAIAAGSALRGAGAGALLSSIRDAFRVTFGPGFPAVARVQSLALVLVVTLLAGGTGLVAARALGLLDEHAPAPSILVPTPTVPAPSAPPSPSPAVSPSPSPTPLTSDPAPTATPEDTEHPRGTDDHGGGSGGDSGSGGGSGSGHGSDSGGGSGSPGSGSGSGSSGRGTATAEPADDHGGDRKGDDSTKRPTGEDHAGPG